MADEQTRARSTVMAQAMETNPPRREHILIGSVASSPVRIEVFSDLQNIPSRDFFINVIQPIISEYGDRISIVYYEFPYSENRYAYPASRYIAAASRLGRNQVMSVYEALFNNHDSWTVDGNFENVISNALSAEDFQEIQDSLQFQEVIDRVIEAGLYLGIDRGVNSTPTVFIYHGDTERRFNYGTTYDEMKQILDPIAR